MLPCELLFVTGIVVRNTLVLYDRENSKIGFWKTNCSELWERLHVDGAPPPAPSSSNGNNSNTEMPPSMAPGDQKHYGLPGMSSSRSLINSYMAMNLKSVYEHIPFCAHTYWNCSGSSGLSSITFMTGSIS